LSSKLTVREFLPAEQHDFQKSHLGVGERGRGRGGERERGREGERKRERERERERERGRERERE